MTHTMSNPRTFRVCVVREWTKAEIHVIEADTREMAEDMAVMKADMYIQPAEQDEDWNTELNVVAVEEMGDD